MEEQHRRRRRPQGEIPQEEQAVQTMQETPQASAPAQQDPASGNQQAHHRRRHMEQNARQALPDDGRVFWDEYEQANSAKKDQQHQHSKPVRAFFAVDHLVCKIGDFCLAAIKWLSIGLLFVLGFFGKGIKRLLRKIRSAFRSDSDSRAQARGATHTGKRIKKDGRKPTPSKPEKKTDAEEGVTLVAIRPEEYRGMGDKRSQQNQHHHHLPHLGGEKKKTVRAPQKKKDKMYMAANALLTCVAVVSACMVVSILYRSISTRMLEDSLSARYSQLSGEPEAEMSEMTVYGAEETTDVMAPELLTEAAIPVAVQETPVPTAAPTKAPVVKDTVVSTKYHQVGGDALPEMAALYEDNRDLVGWLRMEGILDLPVVYRDNSYYLTRDFYKKKSASGTLFLDENHPFKEHAQNLLLHGHNMKDGTMFGRLVQYETNLQFLKNNPFIQYSTLWKKEQYVIFAVLHVSLDVKDENFFNYFTHHTFASDSQFEHYVRSLQNRSVFSIPVDVKPSDALLTLSTCLDEDRLVIVARRLRPGESKSDLRHLVQLADRQ